MKVLSLIANTDQQGYVHLSVPTEIIGESVEVVLVVHRAELPPDGRKHYDFEDLAGKLSWQGDALAEQEALRNEW